MVKSQYKFKQKLKVWAKECKLYIERVVVKELNPCENLLTRMDYME